MFRYPRSPMFLVSGFCFLVVFLFSSARCGTGGVGQEEQIVNVETSRALTAEAFVAVTDAPSPPPQTETTGPTATPTSTPKPSPTSLPPTPTVNPDLVGFSFCTQPDGETTRPAPGRFSAFLSEVTAESFPAYDRVAFHFRLSPDSAPLHAIAYCLSQDDFLQRTTRPQAPGPYVIRVDLDGWLRDDAFTSSLITDTVTFTQTQRVTGILSYVEEQSPTGGSLILGVNQAAPFRFSVSQEPLQLVVDIARPSPLTEASDPLTVETGSEPPTLTDPLFFLLNGDIGRLDSTGVITLTQSPEQETDLAVSPDGTLLAFCRTNDVGVFPQTTTLAVPSSLWLMRSDGSQSRQRAALGVSCADVRFSPDGSMLALSVDETGMLPTQRSIWTVPITETQTLTPTSALTNTAVTTLEARRVAGGDGWNRFAPQWLDHETLVYAADAPDGRSTLLLTNVAADTPEQDIGAGITVGERYERLGEPLVAPDGATIAVEAMRSRGAGADMVILDRQGKHTDVISRGFWTRPLAWSDAGNLFSLTTTCTSTLVHQYELYEHDPDGQNRLILSGTTLGTVGAAIATETGLAYVAASSAKPGIRGHVGVAWQRPSSLWVWDIDQGRREMFYEAYQGMTALVRPLPRQTP